MSKKQSIEQFLTPKKFAIAGVSANTKKFGYTVFNELKQKGYDICPINPKLDELEGVKCYNSIHKFHKVIWKLFGMLPK